MLTSLTLSFVGTREAHGSLVAPERISRHSKLQGSTKVQYLSSSQPPLREPGMLPHGSSRLSRPLAVKRYPCSQIRTAMFTDSAHLALSMLGVGSSTLVGEHPVRPLSSLDLTPEPSNAPSPCYCRLQGACPRPDFEFFAHSSLSERVHFERP
ncbi:hypothetical protein VTO73DRAFT_10364 [Trametes versicolor]